MDKFLGSNEAAEGKMTCKNKEPVSSEIEEIASEPRMEEIASEPRMEGNPVLATGVTTPSLLVRNATLSKPMLLYLHFNLPKVCNHHGEEAFHIHKYSYPHMFKSK